MVGRPSEYGGRLHVIAVVHIFQIIITQKDRLIRCSALTRRHVMFNQYANVCVDSNQWLANAHDYQREQFAPTDQPMWEIMEPFIATANVSDRADHRTKHITTVVLSL